MQEKKGKYIYLGSWWTFVELPYPAPDLDFVTISPRKEEVRNLKLDEAKWDEIIRRIREKAGDIPILVFIDWAGTTDTPLGVFSQELTKEEQREFIRILDEFCTRKGLIFVYPVHGGYMGKQAEKLSFGELRVYDALAPEFETYETIKELAQRKKS